MNQTQVKYVKTRAEKIYSAKLKALKDKHTTPPFLLSTEDKLSAIVSGAFSIADKPIGTTFNPQWFQFIRFDGEITGGLDKDSYEKEKKVVDLAYETLLDEVVLGDNITALELLRNFAEATD